MENLIQPQKIYILNSTNINMKKNTINIFDQIGEKNVKVSESEIKKIINFLLKKKKKRE